MSKGASLTAACLGLLLAGCASSNPFRGDRPRPVPDDDVEIAYGEQDEEDVTGAVSSVSMDETGHMQSILEMLRSQVPGLQATRRADGTYRLRLRGGQQSLRAGDGANEPLIVLDGMPLQSGANGLALKGLNPKEVESISVLRDVSSTVIYGSKGANGVILITLKR